MRTTLDAPCGVAPPCGQEPAASSRLSWHARSRHARVRSTLIRQLIASFPSPSRAAVEVFGFDERHRRGESATHPCAPRSTRHAALLLLAGRSPLRRRALPGTPIAARTGAFNCRIKVEIIMRFVSLAIAKIQTPRFRSGLIERSDLEQQLGDSLASRRIVLLVAPAGYGKTA